MHGTFPLSDKSGFGKNVLIFRVDSSSYFHADNRNKDILVLGKGPTDWIDDTTLTAEAEYSINYSEQQEKFCVRLHYNESNSLNEVSIYQFKAKNS